MSFKFFSLLIFSFLVLSLNSQTPIVDVDFNDCNIIDKGSLGENIILINDAECSCGLVGESFEFDGVKDGINFDNKVNFLFNSDFTLEFYFTVDNRFDIVDLVSFKNECSGDSSFSIQYYPSINEIRFLAKGSGYENIELKLPLDDSQCWHHFAVVRNGFKYFIYLDGEISEKKNAGAKYVYSDRNIFSISNNSCDYDSNSRFLRFKGRMDEFKIFNYALNELELRGRRILSDQILNQDTTIYLGDSIGINVGPTCADNFNWTGKKDLSNPDILTPFIKPKKSTKYYINFLMRGRTCRDSIFVHVLDKEQLDCNGLLVPNSFTPNGDGINDVLKISNNFIIDELKSFEVFDRWGTRVFRTQDKNLGWDGLYKKEKINPGKLVYKVRYICKNEEYLTQGIINLLR